jgi:hypothetical protein
MYTGFIYKIVADDTDKVYYGSTIQNLNVRFSGHKSHFVRSRNYCYSHELFNYANTRIERLETHTNMDKNLLKKTLIEIESGYILRFRKYRPGICVNKNLPNRKKKQYRIDNADKKKQYSKQHRINNADKIKQYRIDNRDKQKEYQSKNKIKIKEQKRLYYLAKK